MNKRIVRLLGAVVLVLLCIAVFVFLQAFTREMPALNYIHWDSAAVVNAAGETRPLDPASFEQPALAAGERLWFSGTLPEIEDGDELLLEISGAVVELSLDGAPLLTSESALPPDALGQAQVQIPLPVGAAGRRIELTCMPLNGPLGIYPPPLRVVNPLQLDASTIAYANFYGLPAGALAAVFLLICFLCYVGVLQGCSDLTLPLLAVASGIVMVNGIAMGCGYAFLPPALLEVLYWSGWKVLPPVLMLIYLLLNHKRAFLRRLGGLTVVTATGLLLLYMGSRAVDGLFASRFGTLVEDIFRYGNLSGGLYWLTVYLIGACALIAGHGVVERAVQLRSEAAALELRADLAMRTCHSLEENSHRTAAMRHELKNEITALDLMYRQGDLDGLGRALDDLNAQQAHLTQQWFTDHFTVNAILQDAADKAAAQGVRFDAQVSLPEELSIPVRDLCSMLINLLDNAVCAAAKAGEKGHIAFRCQVKGGFLAVKCENTYVGPLQLDPETGRLCTTKEDGTAHGFGLQQMESIAKKYGSLLDLSYTEDLFTVQTALQLPE